MINRVVLVGRLTKDIELKKTQSGLSVATFTVACNRRVAQGQERSADFINCVAWRQSAEFMAQYAKKGALVGVEGRISTRNYDGADGKKVYVTEVVCDSCQILESKGASENRSSSFNQTNYTPSFTADSNVGGFDDNRGFDDFTSGNTFDISSDDLPF